MLVLDESASRITVPVLKKLKELARSGVMIAGSKPINTPSLSDDLGEFKALVNEIWGGSYANVKESRDYGGLLRSSGVPDDVFVSSAKAKVMFVHRKWEGNDVYWLNSRSAEPNQAEISFRVSGKVPELWHPVTGSTEKVAYRTDNGHTVLSLKFDPWDAYFIVFRDNTTSPSISLPAKVATPVLTLAGPWQVSFQEGRGALANTTFETLTPWNENADTGLKYFSGTATYQAAFIVPKLTKGARYQIDLGEVKNLAEVAVNGKPLGTVWKTPFTVDVTSALKKGANTIEIKVTNLWVNRLIGDAQPGVKEKITFTTMPFYRAESPLVPSGLMGPVRLLQVSSVK
jgi:hypothetical protein